MTLRDIFQTGVLAALVLCVVGLPKVAAPQDTRYTINWQSRQVVVDGYRLRYEIAGRGKPLLFLHGMTLTRAEWRPIAEQLTDSFTVILADLPGHGGSSAHPGTFNFAKTARLFHGLLDTLGIDHVSLIGHSAGGITSLAMTVQRPERIDCLTLVDAPHRFPETARQIARKDSFEALDPETKEWYIGLHPGGEKQVREIFRQYQALAETRLKVPARVLRTLDVPTLLVWGDRDLFFPLDLPLEMYYALPNAQLWVVAEAGHAPLWPELGGTERAADEFLVVFAEFYAAQTARPLALEPRR